MKKYAFLFILLLLIPVYIYATDGVNTVEHPAKVNSVATPDKVCGVSGLAAGGGCTTALWTNTGATNGDLDIKDSATYTFVGQQIEDSTQRIICKVAFYLSYKAGDISGKTFRAYFYTTSTDDLDSGSEADDTVTGSNDWGPVGTGTAVTFEWATGYTLSANTVYAVVITMDGEPDASNYAEMEHTNNGVIPGGCSNYYDATGVEKGPADRDAKMILYTE